jgi:hypothetical protein
MTPKYGRMKEKGISCEFFSGSLDGSAIVRARVVLGSTRLHRVWRNCVAANTTGNGMRPANGQAADGKKKTSSLKQTSLLTKWDLLNVVDGDNDADINKRGARTVAVEDQMRMGNG